MREVSDYHFTSRGTYQGLCRLRDILFSPGDYVLHDLNPYTVKAIVISITADGDQIFCKCRAGNDEKDIPQNELKRLEVVE